MTDNEIIKALECCKETVADCKCQECPLKDTEVETCITVLTRKAFDLINRQKETIQSQDEMIRALINAQETLQKEIKKLKMGHILYDGEV